MSIVLEDLPQTKTIQRKLITIEETVGDLTEHLRTLTEIYTTLHENYTKINEQQEKIGFVEFDEFELDLNKMKTGQRYIIRYDDSNYGALKNEKGDLELYELD